MLITRTADKQTDGQVSGQITVCTLNDGLMAFVSVAHVAAEVDLGGPSRLVFGGGGQMDICGSPEYWRRAVRIAELECHDDVAEDLARAPATPAPRRWQRSTAGGI